MARSIKKPKVIREEEIKDIDGPVEIEIKEKDPVDLEAQELAKAEKKYQNVLKAMELATSSSSKESQNKPRTLTFNAWFQKACSLNPKIKLSYKEAVESHCRSIGIAHQATEEEFYAALAHFGL